MNDIFILKKVNHEEMHFFSVYFESYKVILPNKNFHKNNYKNINISVLKKVV